MEDTPKSQFECYIHELPLDGTWQCPDRRCRAAHCPICGRYERDRCEHLFYTDGEWVYYAPEGVSSEDFPGSGFEEVDLDTLVDAFDGDEELAGRLAEGNEPLRTLLELATERIRGPILRAWAGGWDRGSDSWTNIWVRDPGEALSVLRPLLDRYLRGVSLLRDYEALEEDA